jgi:ubiquinone/menaquinone biosynthesis C-methylase UbiE
MGDYEWKAVDFDHPSFLFVLEDKLKGLVGGPMFYNSYFKTFGLTGNEKVLDFGCGGGVGARCLLKLLGNTGRITCVDISTFWIDRAKRRLAGFSNAVCLAGDIRTLNIPDGSFDVVTAIHVIHDIDPGERQEIVHALSRKLADNGRFFIREPIKMSQGMPVEEIRSLLENAGLLEVSHTITGSEYQGKFEKRASPSVNT